MKYALKMGSGAMTCIISTINIGSRIQKLIKGIHRHTDKKEFALAGFHFFKIRKVS
jgi:hypothetical protein